MPRFRGTRYPLLCRSSAFSPLSIPNLALWLDPTYGLYQERTGASATTPATADGDPVGTWVGRRNTAAGGVYCVANNDARRPSLRTAYVNGYNAVSFDGADDYLTFSGYTPPSVWTLIVAYRDQTAAAANILVGGNVDTRFLYYNTDTTAALYSGTLLTKSATRSAWNIVGATENGASSKIRVNGSSVTTGNSGGGAWSGLSLGGGTTGSYLTVSQFAGLALYESALSDADCALVMAYFDSHVGVY